MHINFDYSSVFFRINYRFSSIPVFRQVRQTSRVKKQREYAQKIVTAIKEVDFAKERYQRLTKEEADKRQSIIDGKLKPKGKLLLKK